MGLICLPQRHYAVKVMSLDDSI